MEKIATYKNEFPTYSDSQIFDLMEQAAIRKAKWVSKKIDEYFEQYLLKTGIKGEITKGKLRWRGIKLHIYSGADYNCYQLVQRGVKISPRLKVDSFGTITYPISYDATT
jgi:hypothetical protein